MRIAILGTRGIPPAYGGFETLAWELSTRLRRARPRGHGLLPARLDGRDGRGAGRASVAGSSRTCPASTQPRSATPASASSTRSFAATTRSGSGNAANALFAGLPRMRGTVVALNVDGIERQRAKWGLAGRLWYAVGERFALVFPNVIVSDAKVIQDYYLERYRRASALIAYGAPILERDPPT